MANTTWTLVNGVNMADDSDVGIFGRLNAGGNTEIAFATGFGVCVVELAGNIQLCTAMTEGLEKFLEESAESMSGCQMYVAANNGDDDITLIGVDDMSEIAFVGIPIDTKVEQSREFEAEEFGEMEEDYPGLTDAMGLAEEF